MSFYESIPIEEGEWTDEEIKESPDARPKETCGKAMELAFKLSAGRGVRYYGACGSADPFMPQRRHGEAKAYRFTESRKCNRFIMPD
jgi:hypothetical protein